MIPKGESVQLLPRPPSTISSQVNRRYRRCYGCRAINCNWAHRLIHFRWHGLRTEWWHQATFPPIVANRFEFFGCVAVYLAVHSILFLHPFAIIDTLVIFIRKLLYLQRYVDNAAPRIQNTTRSKFQLRSWQRSYHFTSFWAGDSVIACIFPTIPCNLGITCQYKDVNRRMPSVSHVVLSLAKVRAAICTRQ